MAQTVKVRLRKPSRIHTFISKNLSLCRNDPCIVRSDRGLEYGVCAMPPEDCSPEEEKRYKMSVVRRATHHDDTTYRQIGIDEERALEKCREKIRERDLPMKLVECEYAFDRKKIIFYFTAEDRVDFRELVRDLAQDLKARIELRHIQVRDEAKIVGGVGTCGRELCCTTWMREFVPISMKMAKRQNLSLNPAKISGQCGRLMCCLSYENDQYSSVKKAKKPKPSGDPAEIRGRMEAEPTEAVRALKDSTLSDIIGDEVADVIGDEVAAPGATDSEVEQPTQDKGQSSDPSKDGGDSGAQTPEKAKEAANRSNGKGTEGGGGRRKRRRRRRRGGGGGGGGGQGSQGGQGGQGKSSS